MHCLYLLTKLCHVVIINIIYIYIYIYIYVYFADSETHVPEWCCFKCVDDKNVKPRFLRIDNRTQSLHYFNAYAVRERVNSSDLPCKEVNQAVESASLDV